MSDDIRAALEGRLAAMTPALATQLENVAYTPVSGTPYQTAALLPGVPDNGTLGSAHRFEQGSFLVTLYYPFGAGAGDAQDRAEAVRAQFKRGTSMSSGSTTTVVTRTPAKAQATYAGDRYVVAVSIPYQAELFG